MEALDYEDLIRRVYGVERYGVRGADADIYRELQASAQLLEYETTNIRMGRRGQAQSLFQHCNISTKSIAAAFGVLLQKRSSMEAKNTAIF